MALFVAVETMAFCTLFLSVFRRRGWSCGADTTFGSPVFVPGMRSICTCVHHIGVRSRHLDSQDFGKLLQRKPLLLQGVLLLPWVIIVQSPKDLHCCVILVVLMNCIGPVYKSLRSVDFVDVIHHVEGSLDARRERVGGASNGYCASWAKDLNCARKTSTSF
jgi:hypothetical protein